MKTILPLMFCGSLAKAAFVLPDISYDQTQVTCSNVQTLLGLSTADLSRLKYAADVVIPTRIQRLSMSKRATEKSCDFEAGASTMLLQKSKVKADGSLDDLCSNIGHALDTLSQQLQAETISIKPYERTIDQRIDRLDDVRWTVTETCNLVSERLLDHPPSLVQLYKSDRKLATNDGNLDQACQGVTSAIDQLSDYLEFVRASLQSDYVGGVLPSRIQTLTQKNTACIQASLTAPMPTIVRIVNPKIWEYLVSPFKIATLGDYFYKVSLAKDTLIEFIANGHSSGGGSRLITRFYVDETPIGTPSNAGLNPATFTFGEFLTDATSGWQPLHIYQVMVVPKGDHVISFRYYSENPAGAKINGVELILKIFNN